MILEIDFFAGRVSVIDQAPILPLAVEHDGPAACNPQDDCLYLNAPDGTRVAVINHQLPNAVELAHAIAKQLNVFTDVADALRMARAELQGIYENSTIIPGKALADDRPIIEHVDAALRDLGTVELIPAPKVDPQQRAMYAAFVMEGMTQVTWDDLTYIDAVEKWGRGAFELAAAVMAHLPIIDALVEAAIKAGGQYQGVFEYEVCAPFGRWMMEQLLDTGELPSQLSAISHIESCVSSFFTRNGNAPEDLIYPINVAIANAALAILYPGRDDLLIEGDAA